MSLLINRKGRVLQITLNRPKKRNAIDLEMSKGIVDAVEAVRDDAHIGSILLDAIGPVFCSGMDLDEALETPPDQLAAVHEQLFTVGCRSLKPIVVAACGSAFGGGLALLAQGHIIVMAEGAAFGLTEIRVGLWPFIAFRAVESALGHRRTLEMSLTGRILHAPDALKWGLAQQVCPGSEVADRAMGVARDLGKASPQAISAGLQYCRDSHGKSRAEAGKIATSLRLELMGSDDFQEGCAAFKDKREPHWPSMPHEFYSGKQSPPVHASSAGNGSAGKATGKSEQ